MGLYNLMVTLRVFFGYTVLVFGLSVLFLRPVLKGKRFSVCFLACFLTGNFYIMNTVFVLLLFFHCTNKLITILVFIMTPILLRMLFNYKKAGKSMKEGWDKFQRLIAGTYGWRLFFKETKEMLFGGLTKGISFILAKHQIEILGVLICLAIQAFYTGYRLVIYSGFGGYDEIVHSGWIQHMMGGQIYAFGVYPFGFHEIVYSIAKVFGLPAPQVVRYFGFVIMIYMTLMLYCLIADTLNNRITAFLVTFIYAGVNIYYQVAWDRCGFGYPQEFGAVFLYPMIIFLFQYFKEKKKFYLFFFGMSFSLTLYVHYYITIIALMFCLSAGIVYLIYMIRKKLLLPVLICGLLASAVGIMTMVLGVAAGHPLQGSLYWALGVISGEKGGEAQEQEAIGTGNAENTGNNINNSINNSTGNTGPEAGNNGILDTNSTALNHGIGTSSAITGNAEIGTGSSIQAENERQKGSFSRRLLSLLSQAKAFLWRLYNCIHEARVVNCMTENSFRMFSVFTIASLLIAIYCFLPGQDSLKGAFILSFLCYIFFLDILMVSGELGLPILIENYRVRVFLCYALPYMLAVPAHIGIELLGKSYGGAAKEQTVLQRISMVPVVVFAIVTLTRYNLYRYPGRTTVIQSDSVVDVFYQILEDYDDFSWTLVSDVQEYAMCLQNGYHYEWTELLQKLSSGVTNIKIPTKYIFFAIEKRPIEYGTIIENGTEVPVLGKVSKYYAKQGFSYGGDLPYITERLQIMSKAYYWARAYAEKFPEEMQVYYEDENIIYYRLTQEPYYLNNLKIDYGYNDITSAASAASQETETGDNIDTENNIDTEENIDTAAEAENVQEAGDVQ